jgi:hypothetical protein
MNIPVKNVDYNGDGNNSRRVHRFSSVVGAGSSCPIELQVRFIDRQVSSGNMARSVSF